MRFLTRGGGSSVLRAACTRPMPHAAPCLASRVPAGRCVILTCDTARTMRTCINPDMMLRPAALQPAAFAGCTHAFISAYCCYSPGLLAHAMQLAQQASPPMLHAYVARWFGA